MKSLKIKSFQDKINLVAKEHDVLDYWEETKAFEKSISQRPASQPYIFYDGPPFATGTPHYGHILVSTIKDTIPRYWTMKGYRVERVWGWDCHGLPIENIVEKELGLKGGRKAIENMGIGRFNDACRAAIWRFDKEWERVIRRIGRWVDFKNSYKTMDTTFMESVWWAFKTLYDKGLVYQGRRVILYCPRCATPLSNFEIAMDNSYKDVEDYSLFVKFSIKGRSHEYLLAWTTTPWTLLGNVALAVNPEADYLKVQKGPDIYYLAKARREVVGKDVATIKEMKGKDLVGLQYEPLFTYLNLGAKKAHYVAAADFVSLEEGTGIVHTAAIYGEDDYNLAQKIDLPLVPMLDDQGKFLDFVTPLAGQYYKKSEAWVVGELTNRQPSLIYQQGKLIHSVAHCYRCDTKLYYNAVPAWFINIKNLKKDLLEQNEHINWYPDHLKHGRFGKGLEDAPDWNISRSRYWGTPMPIWIGESGKLRVIGSRQELRNWAVEPNKLGTLDDIHREHLDHLEVWVDDQKTEKGRRLPEVFDCWVESGSMPYASVAYPLQNKQKFESSYPAQFIVEYIAQTRAWFYTLHVMSVAIFGKPAFENALTTGNIQGEDGQKMSKSKKNYPDPEPLFERYGVDALRFYLLSSAVMKADNTNFSETGVKEVYQKLINILWNVFSFYKLYAQNHQVKPSAKPSHLLDRWLVSRLASTQQSVTTSLDSYDTVGATRQIQDFITDLSTWYLRRSRGRLRTDRHSLAVFAWVLDQTVKIMAPLTPFITELIYQNLTPQKISVHLEAWPQPNLDLQNTILEGQMNTVRAIVEKIHAARQTAGIRIRQPLAIAKISLSTKTPIDQSQELLEILKEEINVKEIIWETAANNRDLTVVLDTNITKELACEGKAREIVRAVQQARKDAHISLDQTVTLTLPDWPDEFTDYIKEKTLATTLVKGKKLTIT